MSQIDPPSLAVPEAREEPDPKSSSPRNAMVFLFVVAFLNTMGISIFIPIMPFIVRQYVPDPAHLAIMVGWLLSVYALCQFLAAPLLGALSDRYGRRPLLLICLLGSAIGYTLFGFGGALWVLFLGRIIDGITGGNFGILSAYIGDCTEPEERGKYFGRFGAVAGAGFIAGPAIGGLVSQFGANVPAYVAVAITTLSLIWGYFFLPESLRDEHRATHMSLKDLNLFRQLRDAFALPQLRWLLIATFCFMLPFAMMGANLAVLLIDNLGWKEDTISYLFLLVGVMDIVMQGILTERLLPIFGEVTLTIVGLICESLALALFGAVAVVASPVLVIAATFVMTVGSGFREPASRGLISRLAGPRQQGIVQGGNQSVQSLAMVIGPLLSGMLYTQLGHGVPFWVGAGMILFAVAAVAMAVPSLRTYASLSAVSEG